MFIGSATGVVSFEAKRRYVFVVGADMDLDDDVMTIVRDRCYDFEIEADAIYLSVETEIGFDGIVDKDHRVDLLDLVREAQAYLAGRLNNIEQELDRCIELHQKRSEEVSEASDEALKLELRKRGINVPSVS